MTYKAVLYRVSPRQSGHDANAKFQSFLLIVCQRGHTAP